jgi:hypothetical protein
MPGRPADPYVASGGIDVDGVALVGRDVEVAPEMSRQTHRTTADGSMTHPLRRGLHLLVAAAFLAGLEASSGAHRDHQLRVAAQSAEHAAQAAHAAHDRRPSPATSAPEGGATPSGHAEDHHGQGVPCDCVGACHATAAVPMPTFGEATPSLAPLESATVAVPKDRRDAPRSTRYLLPFANAPPRA